MKHVFPNCQRVPAHGVVGMALVAVAWPLNWLLPGLRTHLLFFPLWLGYALVVDALTFCRAGTSLFTKSHRKYAELFLISAPAWWLFEALNLRTQNWHYVGREFFTNTQYALLATLSFSTVMPAVFGTASLMATFEWVKRFKGKWLLKPSKNLALGAFLSGWLMLGLLLGFPRYFYPFLWLSLYFIIEPLNIWLKNRHLLECTQTGDWRPIAALWSGVLVTAFFWEFWNYHSYPKWVYNVPFVGCCHIFEMPLLGYLGYLPFSLELYALYHFVVGALGRKRETFLTSTLCPKEDR